jgi:hypothetical protein
MLYKTLSCQRVFNEILTSIVKFYPNKNQSVVLAQDDESRNELPEENRIKFNY